MIVGYHREMLIKHVTETFPGCHLNSLSIIIILRPIRIFGLPWL